MTYVQPRLSYFCNANDYTQMGESSEEQCQSTGETQPTNLIAVIGGTEGKIQT